LNVEQRKKKGGKIQMSVSGGFELPIVFSHEQKVEVVFFAFFLIRQIKIHKKQRLFLFRKPPNFLLKRKSAKQKFKK
jgi:hypothetical protein